MYCLRDRSDPASSPVVLSETALLLISLLDGQRTVEALDAAFTLRAGVRLPRAEIGSFLERLDEANLLDSPAFRRRLERQRSAFARSPQRPPIHAGGAYPAKQAELKAFIGGF